MPHNKETTKLYELGGASLAAALEVNRLMQEDLLRDVDAFSSIDHVEVFKETHKNLLDKIGQSSRAVQIKMDEGCHSRAHEHTPHCYFHPVHHDRVLMQTPVDYKGRHFIPEDAVELTGKDREVMESGLFCGGWSDPEPIWSLKRPRGIATPADFDVDAHYYESMPAHALESAVKKTIRGVFNLKAMIMDGSVIHDRDDQDKISLQVCVYVDDAMNPVLELGAYHTEKKKMLPFRSDVVFTTEKMPSDMYKMTPNLKTALGFVMQGSLDKIKAAIPDPEKIWQEENKRDLETGIVPPPPPRELLHLYPKAPWPFPKSGPTP